MGPIIKWNLWQRRWFIFWWAFGISAFMVISLIFYPIFRDQAAQINQAISHLPAAAKSLFTDTGSFSTPEDFLSGRSIGRIGHAQKQDQAGAEKDCQRRHAKMGRTRCIGDDGKRQRREKARGASRQRVDPEIAAGLRDIDAAGKV